MKTYPFNMELALEGRVAKQRKPKREVPVAGIPEPKADELRYIPAEADVMSRYSAANNRHFGANIGFALERVSK